MTGVLRAEAAPVAALRSSQPAFPHLSDHLAEEVIHLGETGFVYLLLRMLQHPSSLWQRFAHISVGILPFVLS